MNASDVLYTLNKIGETSSRNEKEELIDANIGDQLFKDVLSISYDPFITWGITPPKVETSGHADFDLSSPIWALLHGLQTRAITGGEANQLVLEWLMKLNPQASELLYRILQKDLRCGISVSTINKVMPGTVPVFDVMLAKPFEDKRIKTWPAIAEPKLDGVRVICLVKDGKAQFFSRSGKPFPAVDHLGPAVVRMLRATKKAADSHFSYAFRDQMLGKNADTIALDGEITTGSFNKSSGDVRRKSETATDAVYAIFDAIPYDVMTGDAAKFDVPYSERRKFVHWLVGVQSDPAIKRLPSYFVNTPDEARDFYQKFRDEGLEGAIIKPLEAPYEKKRSFGWLKLKAEETEDLRVVGTFAGKEGTRLEGKFAGVIVEREHAGAMVQVRVGGGFSYAQLEEFDADPSKVEARLIEVEFHEVTPDGSLRHPRFVRFRDDKDMSAREAA